MEIFSILNFLDIELEVSMILGIWMGNQFEVLFLN